MAFLFTQCQKMQLLQDWKAAAFVTSSFLMWKQHQGERFAPAQPQLLCRRWEMGREASPSVNERPRGRRSPSLGDTAWAGMALTESRRAPCAPTPTGTVRALRWDPTFRAVGSEQLRQGTTAPCAQALHPPGFEIPPGTGTPCPGQLCQAMGTSQGRNIPQCPP